jgi:hypothetical protein
LLDYVDYYTFSGTMNPYRHLTEVSGMNERSIRRILTSLENKGLLKRVVNLHGNGRTKGVVFSIAPLVRRLKTVMKKMSPTVGEEIVPYVGEESVPPNTGEEFKKREEDKNTSVKNTDVRARACGDAGVKEDMFPGETAKGLNKRQSSHTLWFASPTRDSEDTSSHFAEGVRFLHPFRTVVRNDKGGVHAVNGVSNGWQTGVEVETDYGFIRGTGGPVEEAPRNDRRPARERDAGTEGDKASQIHLARAGEGPRGLVEGEDEEGRVYHPYPETIPDRCPGHGSGQGRELNAKDEIAAIADSGGGVTEESYPGTGSVSFRPSTGSGRTGNGSHADLNDEPAEVPLAPRKDGKRGAYSSSRWYNEVWRGLYEEAAGQPALKGMREYRAAETYFRRLRELNPEMEPGDVYELAGEGAAFMIASQLEGGVFGWMHKPPDICMLASQAQSVEWHLRKMRRGSCVRDGPREGGAADSAMSDAGISFRERLREGKHANEQIERVYGELRGIESRRHWGSFENDAGRGSGQALRQFDPSTSSGRTVERRALRRGRG